MMKRNSAPTNGNHFAAISSLIALPVIWLRISS